MMNARSLSFRLVAWYAGLLSGCFVLVGAAAYFLLQNYMENELRDSQMRRARQIALLLGNELRAQDMARTGDEVESRYAPGANLRFVRITRGDGRVLYVSSAPPDQSFDPKAIPASNWPDRIESARPVRLPDGRTILLAQRTVLGAGSSRFLVEVGALMDSLQSELRRLLMFMVVGLPIVIVVGVWGGYFLVKRALQPVDQIAATAQRISSENLDERLPVRHTGDEIERLSIALNRMIERLDEAFGQARRFMADASHELRTPLTVLRGELEAFVDDPQLSPELRERAGSALEEVHRLTKIVEGLFAISRLDAGEAQAESVKFDLAQLAASTADQMFLLAEDKNVRVSCASTKGVWVQGDRARLKQVVVNLLDNAIKYTPSGGAVRLQVKPENGKAVLEVADNGIGIPSEALPHVFERFYRVDQARTRELGGAGLGLSIVKSICTAHRGQVLVTSTPNQGTRFRVELPGAKV